MKVFFILIYDTFFYLIFARRLHSAASLFHMLPAQCKCDGHMQHERLELSDAGNGKKTKKLTFNSAWILSKDWLVKIHITFCTCI